MKKHQNQKLALATALASLAMLSSSPAQFDVISSSQLQKAASQSQTSLAPPATPSLVFDNMSNFENSVADAGVASTSSTPNTFMGGGYVLTPGTTDITGFDVYPVNASGTNYNALKINIFVWGTVNTGTVNATTPAFGNLLASYTLTSVGTFTTGFYFPFEGVPNGSSPGIILATPLSIPSTTIGVSFNYQGSIDGGANYNSANNLTSLISYGTPASVGSEVFNGYYRNANSETNGNFTSTLRSIGEDDQTLALRIYGDVIEAVPEPGTAFAALAAGGVCVAGGLRRLRKRAQA